MTCGGGGRGRLPGNDGAQGPDVRLRSRQGGRRSPTSQGGAGTKGPARLRQGAKTPTPRGGRSGATWEIETGWTAIADGTGGQGPTWRPARGRRGQGGGEAATGMAKPQPRCRRGRSALMKRQTGQTGRTDVATAGRGTTRPCWPSAPWSSGEGNEPLRQHQQAILVLRGRSL